MAMAMAMAMTDEQACSSRTHTRARERETRERTSERHKTFTLIHTRAHYLRDLLSIDRPRHQISLFARLVCLAAKPTNKPRVSLMYRDILAAGPIFFLGVIGLGR